MGGRRPLSFQRLLLLGFSRFPRWFSGVHRLVFLDDPEGSASSGPVVCRGAAVPSPDRKKIRPGMKKFLWLIRIRLY
ncbi:MAG TPA: hypothetical protein PLX98_08420, partial [Candidatus Aminicenantes bacterium]|nr:hypothetical protein [Candidatus Aminicenantes bacterium]